MVEAGMDPMCTIQAATAVAAELLRAEDEVGSAKKGCLPDLIAVPGNPLEDISGLCDVRVVVKAAADNVTRLSACKAHRVLQRPSESKTHAGRGSAIRYTY
jgi:adenine deaminase